MKCAGSVVLPKFENDFSAGRAGTKKHEWLEALVSGETGLTEEVLEWTERFEPKHLEPLYGLQGEVTWEWHPDTGNARHLGDHLHRSYENVTPGALHGTADYCGPRDDVMHVYDLKTGQSETPHPRENAQLRFLALAACRATGMAQARIGILHAADGRETYWQFADIDALELEVIEMEMRKMIERITWMRGDLASGKQPRLVVGEHCKWCKARYQCPARITTAVNLVAPAEDFRAVLSKSLEDDEMATKVYSRWRAAMKTLAEVSEILHARAKENPIKLENGNLWGPVESTRETLDADKVWQVLVELHGNDVAMKALKSETSKAGIARALDLVYEERKLAGQKVTKKALNEEVLAVIRETPGAVTVEQKKSYDEYAPALPAGEDAP